LINPVHEDPLAHFELDEKGLLKGRTEEGVATINILGLNRENLRENRRDMMRAAQELVLKLLTAKSYQKEDLVAEYEGKIFAIAKERTAYTLACWKGLLEGLSPHADLFNPDVIARIVKSHEARMAAGASSPSQPSQ
jgi:hypothetical protein